MILPVKAIIFQVLFLMIAIISEAMVLRWRLRLQRRVSIQYAASLNLLSTLIGWLIFFVAVAWLPTLLNAKLEQQLISFILFDQFFLSEWQQSMNTVIVITAVLTFFGTFLIELNGLILLEYILGVRKFDLHKAFPLDSLNLTGASSNNEEAKPDIKDLIRHHDDGQSVNLIGGEKAYAVLLANALSYSAILLILIARYLSVSRVLV